MIFWLILILALSFFTHKKRSEELKNGVNVTATITKFEVTRGLTNVYVVYEYNGKIINSFFGTNETDSLKINEKIKLSISKQYPDKYIKYVSLAK